MPAFSSYGRLTTRECAELNELSKTVGWDVDYRQQGKGPFEAWIEMSISSGLRVTDQYCNRKTNARGVPPAGHLALLLPMNRGEKGIFQGRPFGENEVAVMCPGSEAMYHTPADLRLMTVCVPMPRLRRAVEAVTHGEIDRFVANSRVISLPAEALTQLSQSSAQMIKPCLSGCDTHLLQVVC
jgi:hypothetical protein